MDTRSPRLRRALRRIAITMAGTAVVVAGLAMLVLPGPGLVTIALGLSILGREHAWAAALEGRARARLRAAARQVRRRGSSDGTVRRLTHLEAGATDRQQRAA